VILMDIRMPGMNGIQATRRIIADAAGPAPRVLVLTTFDLDECVYGALRAGASGFLLKDSGPERLLAAVGGGDALFTSRRMPDRTDPRPMPNPRQASTR
jgi:DNA-binding NarL/FixJ family response regulator